MELGSREIREGKQSARENPGFFKKPKGQGNQIAGKDEMPRAEEMEGCWMAPPTC